MKDYGKSRQVENIAFYMFSLREINTCTHSHLHGDRYTHTKIHDVGLHKREHETEGRKLIISNLLISISISQNETYSF